MPSQRMKRRVTELQRRLPHPPTGDGVEKEKRRRGVLRRLDRLCQEAMGLMTEEEAQHVAEALRQWLDAERSPYALWLGDLFRGRCRLPELAPAVMKELLLAWLSPDCDVFACVCRQCGLLYPHHRSPPLNEWKLLPGKVPLVGRPPWYDLPEFFSSCPGCGASANDFDWSHLVEKLYRPWMEMDGYMGRSCSELG